MIIQNTLKNEIENAGLPVESVNGERVEFTRMLTPDEAKTYRAILRKRLGPTKRQAEILKMAALGMTNKEIAMRCGLSEQTIKNTFSDLYRRINASNRTQAVYMMGAKL